MGGKAFVTVGTTRFDELIKGVDSLDFARALTEEGFSELVVQKGSGAYVMNKIIPEGKASHQLDMGLKVECFDFLPSIGDLMQSSSLIICHAGAGSTFEGLRAGKKLVVVPNTSLMDNHQAELAEHLDNLGHLVCASPSSLPSVVRNLKTKRFTSFQKGSPAQMVNRIDEVMG